MFKQCIYLIETRTKRIGYCLKYREWINNCPEKCGYHKEGETGEMDVITQKKYNMECLYFTRVRSGEKVNYHCKLMIQNEPYCDMCPNAKTTP